MATFAIIFVYTLFASCAGIAFYGIRKYLIETCEYEFNLEFVKDLSIWTLCHLAVDNRKKYIEFAIFCFAICLHYDKN